MTTMRAPVTIPAIIAMNLDAELCTLGGVDHDYRPYAYIQFGRPHISLRCVHCHVVACGDYDQPDPCIEPYHHMVQHRSRDGASWPIGGDRYDRGALG